MTDMMYPRDLKSLLKWVLNEEKNGTIFGVHSDLFFRPEAKDPFRMTRYGKLMETPLGVAAGPQTQLAHNLITAWLTGSRYLELKTVQTLDELEVSKPCIDMDDAGYNCEWSQELRLKQSVQEYLSAWILLHILSHKFQIPGHDKGPGFIFNMSVGYNLEGILNDNVQQFFAAMKDCSAEKARLLEEIDNIYPAVMDFEIPDTLSDNITLSTMHGCPPDEIEKIGRYLIEEKGLNTTIKLNPTLLGPERLREILNTRLGFETHVPDEAFGHDLKYPDAVNLINNLRDLAEKKGVDFGIKLTNTLECVNHRDVFPENEKMMYMSGRALHPVSVNLAAKLQQEFNGELDVSFSAGADCFNISELIACGLKPVTVSSDLLKPGGYGRMSQYAENLRAEFQDAGAGSIDEFILKRAGGGSDVKKAALENLNKYAEQVVGKDSYSKHFFPEKSVKTVRPLSAFDCVKAPCVTTCPASQDVPEYMFHTARGEYQKAMDVILRTNPFPTITGMVCDHLCMTKCTRLNYDMPLRIRDIKRFVVEQTAGSDDPKPVSSNGQTAAVIGAGPSGLSAAWFLALGGFSVDVFEAKPFAGGMAADAIPGFRLTNEQIRQDIARIERLGVKIRYNEKIDRGRFEKLREEYRFVYVGTGAQENRGMGIPGEDCSRVYSALEFLSAARRGSEIEIGKRVAVVGGGNSAMDAARTAYRMTGEDGEVTLLYRRTIKEMPADKEELDAIIEEGITILELTNPSSIAEDGGVLKILCDRMKLGEPDDSGRRRPEKTGETVTLEFDSIMMAIGQSVRPDLGSWEEFQADPVTCETRIDGVYAGGDLVHGALNLITGIADGRKAAEDMIRRTGGDPAEALGGVNKELSEGEMQLRSARRKTGVVPQESSLDNRKNFDVVIGSLTAEQAKEEASRCLYCSDACNVCVTVCPNRANMSYHSTEMSFKLQVLMRTGDSIATEELGRLDVRQHAQVCNIADFCNECGNCRTFCPTAGAPYQDKPRVCLSEAAYAPQEKAYRLIVRDDRKGILFKENGKEQELVMGGDCYHYSSDEGTVTLSRKDLSYISGELKADRCDLTAAASMAVLLEGLADTHLYPVIG